MRLVAFKVRLPEEPEKVFRVEAQSPYQAVGAARALMKQEKESGKSQSKQIFAHFPPFDNVD